MEPSAKIREGLVTLTYKTGVSITYNMYVHAPFLRSPRILISCKADYLMLGGGRATIASGMQLSAKFRPHFLGL